jgi:hypothetical protein
MHTLVNGTVLQVDVYPEPLLLPAMRVSAGCAALDFRAVLHCNFGVGHRMPPPGDVAAMKNLWLPSISKMPRVKAHRSDRCREF